MTTTRALLAALRERDFGVSVNNDGAQYGWEIEMFRYADSGVPGHVTARHENLARAIAEAALSALEAK